MQQLILILPVHTQSCIYTCIMQIRERFCTWQYIYFVLPRQEKALYMQLKTKMQFLMWILAQLCISDIPCKIEVRHYVVYFTQV